MQNTLIIAAKKNDYDCRSSTNFKSLKPKNTSTATTKKNEMIVIFKGKYKKYAEYTLQLVFYYLVGQAVRTVNSE